MPSARVTTYAASRIVEALTISGDRAKIPAGDFAKFIGGLNAADWIYCAIRSATAREIVKVVVGESNVFEGLKIERGQDGDTAAAWPAGSLIYQVLNAAMLHNTLYQGQYREVAYNPNGVLAPLYFGEKVYQADEVLWWMGVGGTEWRLIAGEKVVATPTISPEPGEYGNFQAVTMECLTPGASIYYTLDGSDPDETANTYTGPFLLPANATTTVKAIGIHPDRWWTNSAVASATYATSTEPAETPVFNPPAGSYPSGQQLSIETSPSLAVIHYTMDGTDPDESSPVYDGPLILQEGDSTIKAYAAKSPDGGALWLDSAIAEAAYTIKTLVVGIAATRYGILGRRINGTCVSTSAALNDMMVNWQNVSKIHGSVGYAFGITPYDTYYEAGSRGDRVNRWSGYGWNLVDICGIDAWYVGLKPDGTVVRGELSAPNPPAGVIAFDCEMSYLLCLMGNGTVYYGGSNNYLGPAYFYPWNNIIQIDAASEHCLGLKADGTVLAVGRDLNGRLDVGGWTDIIQVAAGGNFSVGLKSDGTCVAVGHNYYGQINVTEWTDIIQIAAGSMFTAGLKADGTVVATGSYTNDGIDISDW